MSNIQVVPSTESFHQFSFSQYDDTIKQWTPVNGFPVRTNADGTKTVAFGEPCISDVCWYNTNQVILEKIYTDIFDHKDLDLKGDVTLNINPNNYGSLIICINYTEQDEKAVFELIAQMQDGVDWSMDEANENQYAYEEFTCALYLCKDLGEPDGYDTLDAYIDSVESNNATVGYSPLTEQDKAEMAEYWTEAHSAQ